MLYSELLREILTMIKTTRPEWDIENHKITIVQLANGLIAKDDDDNYFIDAGMCPKCYTMGRLVTYKDKTLCTECGNVFIEVT